MLADHRRNAAYAAAIRRVVRPALNLTGAVHLSQPFQVAQVTDFRGLAAKGWRRGFNVSVTRAGRLSALVFWWEANI